MSEKGLELQFAQSDNQLPEEVARIVRDLRSKQIDLERQNEELLRAKEVLADFRDDYADLYDFAPVGYATLNDEGIILKSNVTFANMLGRERRSLLNARLLGFIVSEDRGIYCRFLRAYFESLERKSWELRMLKESDVPFWVRIDGVVVETSADRKIELRLAIIDITEQKRAEEEKKQIEAELRHSQKMEAVGQMASGIAHEFNNLIAGIRNNTDFLAIRSSDVLSAQSCIALEQIETAAARAHTLTNQLLSFSRKYTPTGTTFDLNLRIADCKLMVEKLIGPAIELNVVSNDQPLFVCAAEEEIGQVIVNLVLNARDAITDAGTITIQSRLVTLLERDVPENCQAGQYVELSVADDGCGMSQETCERIFEPFFTTKPVGKGTGLGLSVAYSDIANYGGFMRVDSEEGVGSVVSTYLPLALDSDIETLADAPKPSPASVSGDETILVCDDEDIVRMSVKAMLESHGYSVIAVENAAEALAVAESQYQDISLVLTDITMPGMSGVELGQEIKRRHSHMKVLYSSGYGSHQIEADVDIEVLHKGGQSGELLQLIRELLDNGKPTK